MPFICGQHYLEDAGAKDCLLVHQSRPIAQREHVRWRLVEEVAHSLTSASSSVRTVEDPFRAAEGVVNVLIERSDLLQEAARAFTGEVTLSDDELWAEVQRRQLVVRIGFVNANLRSQYEDHRYVLFDQDWQNRWPVFGLRGGDSIHEVDDQP